MGGIQMNKKILIVGGLVLFALSKKTKASDYETIGNTISYEEGTINAGLIMDTSNNLFNLQMPYNEGTSQYLQLLEIQKQVASLGLQNSKDSGFMNISEGFSKLANSLGIVIK